MNQNMEIIKPFSDCRSIETSVIILYAKKRTRICVEETGFDFDMILITFRILNAKEVSMASFQEIPYFRKRTVCAL